MVVYKKIDQRYTNYKMSHMINVCASDGDRRMVSGIEK